MDDKKTIHDIHKFARELGKQQAQREKEMETSALTDKRKTFLHKQEELAEMVGDITNLFDSHLPLHVSSIPCYADKVFEQNETYILSKLIEMNQSYTTQELDYILSHYAAYISSMATLLRRAKDLDLD